MMRIRLAGIALLLVSAGAGCKGSINSENPGTGGRGGTGASGGAGGCTSDLAGTWDVMATRPGDPAGTHTWVMTIDATTFSMSSESGALVYSAGTTKQLTWTTPVKVTTVSVSNVPDALNAGSVPLQIGGNWTFSANDEICTVSVTAPAASGSCQGPGPYVGAANWPYPLASPRHGQTYTATHLTQLSSQLGDLGGQWRLTNGASGTCMATVEGSRVTATCTNAQPLTGSLQLTLGNDCVASGSSGGYELSARRR